METSPKFTRHVRARYQHFNDLDHAAEDVEHTIGSPGWQVIQTLLGDELRSVLDKLDEPVERYAVLHGRAGGLRAASEAADSLLAHRAAEAQGQRDRHETEVG